jgi:hypothetical protein
MRLLYHNSKLRCMKVIWTRRCKMRYSMPYRVTFATANMLCMEQPSPSLNNTEATRSRQACLRDIPMRMQLDRVIAARMKCLVGVLSVLRRQTHHPDISDKFLVTKKKISPWRTHLTICGLTYALLLALSTFYKQGSRAYCQLINAYYQLEPWRRRGRWTQKHISYAWSFQLTLNKFKTSYKVIYKIFRYLVITTSHLLIYTYPLPPLHTLSSIVMEIQKPSTEHTHSTASRISPLRPLSGSSSRDSVNNGTPSSTTSGSKHNFLVSAIKKPFQGWSWKLMAAKDNLDDDYNFPIVRKGWFEPCESKTARKS